MSYCRFSSMDFACDLYVYRDVGGWYAIILAANRVLGDVPKVDRKSDFSWVGTVGAQMRFLETAKREPIRLKYAGGDFREPTIEAAIARLRELRALGYRFPDSVLEDLEAERDAPVENLCETTANASPGTEPNL